MKEGRDGASIEGGGGGKGILGGIENELIEGGGNIGGGGGGGAGVVPDDVVIVTAASIDGPVGLPMIGIEGGGSECNCSSFCLFSDSNDD